MYNSNIIEGQASIESIWLLTPNFSSSHGDGALEASADGSLRYYYVNADLYGVRPVIYIKSSIKIKSGTGESTNPYKLSL